MLSSIQGYIARSHIEKSACYKILFFTIWNVFFVNVLSGSVLYQANVFLELKNIPSVLAVAVPGQVYTLVLFYNASLKSNLYAICYMVQFIDFITSIFKTYFMCIVGMCMRRSVMQLPTIKVNFV